MLEWQVGTRDRVFPSVCNGVRARMSSSTGSVALIELSGLVPLCQARAVDLREALGTDPAGSHLNEYEWSWLWGLFWVKMPE